MEAFEILRDIYVRPQRAFDEKEMRESLPEAFTWFVGLSLVGACIPLIHKKLSPARAVLGGMYTAVISLVIFGVLVWLVGFFARRKNKPLAGPAFFAGGLWIQVALYPVHWLILFTGASWLLVGAVPWTVWLVALLIQQLTQLNLRQSLWIYVQAMVIVFLVIVALAYLLTRLYS
jgi:hypothetical protein